MPGIGNMGAQQAAPGFDWRNMPMQDLHPRGNGPIPAIPQQDVSLPVAMQRAPMGGMEQGMMVRNLERVVDPTIAPGMSPMPQRNLGGKSSDEITAMMRRAQEMRPPRQAFADYLEDESRRFSDQPDPRRYEQFMSEMDQGYLDQGYPQAGGPVTQGLLDRMWQGMENFQSMPHRMAPNDTPSARRGMGLKPYYDI